MNLGFCFTVEKKYIVGFKITITLPLCNQPTQCFDYASDMLKVIVDDRHIAYDVVSLPLEEGLI